jgi:two-component system, chemotaxis family, response regulator Rcp1
MNALSLSKPCDILLVEDNPGDVRLTEEAFKEGEVSSRLRIRLFVVNDGVQALEFLHRKGKYNNAIRPDLILLDLNLTRKNGREVLADAKSDPDLRNIPIVILSTSASLEDIVKSYSLYANCYITKPADLGEFVAAVKRIQEFWLALVALPAE